VPGYAPERKPAEGVWSYWKHVEMHNVCCDDLPELGRELELAVKRLRCKRRVLAGCVAQGGYAAAAAPADSVAVADRHQPTAWPKAARGGLHPNAAISNPDEGIWSYLKHAELRNVYCADLPELRLELHLPVERLHRKRHVLRGCIAERRSIALHTLWVAPLADPDSPQRPTDRCTAARPRLHDDAQISNYMAVHLG
jgi:hypothetical protein